MCDFCAFHGDLPDWISENAPDGFSPADATRFANRVSSVIKSLAENQFDVSPKFDQVCIDVDAGGEQNTEFVSIVGEKNGESVEVDLFLSCGMLIHSSKEVSGMEVGNLPDGSCDYSIYFDGELMGNWEYEASSFFEKTLMAHRKGRNLNSKISAESFRRARGNHND